MIHVKDNLWVPGDGCKYITDGVVCTDSIYLGKNDSIERWHDTNEEPPVPEDEDITADKALTRYANELTGGNAETLQDATETLIKIVKEDK